MFMTTIYTCLKATLTPHASHISTVVIMVKSAGILGTLTGCWSEDFRNKYFVKYFATFSSGPQSKDDTLHISYSWQTLYEERSEKCCV